MSLIASLLLCPLPEAVQVPTTSSATSKTPTAAPSVCFAPHLRLSRSTLMSTSSRYVSENWGTAADP